MNIFPIHAEQVQRRHWVVRWLRYHGYIICIAATVAGMMYAYRYGSLLFQANNETMAWLIAIASILVGGLVGFVAGLGVSLPWWGLSLAIDDLHALRVYASGYVAYGPDNVQK